MNDDGQQPKPKPLIAFMESADRANESPRYLVQTVLTMLTFALSVGTGPFLSQEFIPQRLYLPIGIGVVVSFGFLGLVFRAVGEWVSSEHSANWKGAGYLMGAFAYVVTASVSLSGAAHLLPSQ